MASRAFGALFALAAVIAFVVAIVMPAFWYGPITLDGHVIEAKELHVGLLGAEGCNVGGEGACESVPVGDNVKYASYGELAIVGLTALLALALAVSAWKIGDRRKGLSTAVIIMALLAGAGAGGVMALGPDIVIQANQSVTVPIGWGLYVFAGAIASALLAAVFARNVEKEPLRLKSSTVPASARVAATPSPGSQPLDVRDILQQETGTVRPSAPQLFEAAPQLRPLYDPTNAGVIPAPTPPAMPINAPTPLPRARIDVLTGNATPPPMMEPPRTKPTTSPPSPPSPPRSKPMSAAPPSAAQSGSMSAAPTSAPHQGSRSKSMSAPPPSPPMAGIPRTNPPSPPVNLAGETLKSTPSKPGRAKTLQAGAEPPPKPRPVVPSPARNSAAQLRPSGPTIAHAVPPMPTLDNQPAPSVLPAQRASTETDDSLEEGMRPTEHITAVEIDHEAKAAASHHRRLATEDVRTGPSATVGDATDVGVQIDRASSHIVTGEQRDLSTQQRQAARAPTEDPFEHAREVSIVGGSPIQGRSPIHAPQSEEMPVARISELVPAEYVPDEGGTAQTLAAPDPSRDRDDDPVDLMATMQRDRGAKADKTPIPTLQRQPRAPSSTPVPSLERPATQVPMSTAPSTLPPPKNLTMETVPSGPRPACPQCEAPMAWVEEHLRFYCKSCRMYF